MRTDPLFAPTYLNRADRFLNEARIRALCANAFLGDGTSLCRVLGRYKMFVDTRDVGISTHLLLDGFWEIWLTETLAEAIAPGMLAVDIGANLGYYSILMADIVGKDGQVHAFEPNTALAGRLRRSGVLNGYDHRMTTHEIALGDEDGALYRFIVSEDDPKNGFMIPAPGASADEPGIIATRRLDSFPALLDADLIKIDADTAEQAIWRGMRGIFDRGRPLTIFLEFNSERYVDPAVFVSDIRKEGFAISRITMMDGPVPCLLEDILNFPAKEDQLLMLVR